MADQESRGAFWTSLPGILTGAAALVTAISGLAIWHNKSTSEPKPEPAAIVQPAAPQPATASGQPAGQQSAAPVQAMSQPQPTSVAASAADPGSQQWCAEKYKAWADQKAETGVDNAGLRKALVSHHCNRYGFFLGKIKPQQ